MGVPYMSDVPNSSVLSFLRLMLRWKGSLWKMVWKELVVWLVAYGVINLIYRFVLTSEQQMQNVCAGVFVSQDLMSLTFMLGFFVTKTIDRWSVLFLNLGFCDGFALSVAGYIAGNDLKSRIARRTIVRYMSMAQVMVYRDISPLVRTRFPTLEDLKFAGFCNRNEVKAFESVKTPGRKYWLPFKWAFTVVVSARNDGLIDNDFAVQYIFKRLLAFRHNLFRLAMYDWAPIPLVYSQVVMFAVRIYFLMNLLGRQTLATERFEERSPLTLYFPVFSVLEFVFHMGWLKVAESLLNPFGVNDENFAVNMIIDRNLKAGLDIVDEGVDSEPPLEKDAFWEENVPEHLYSAETVGAALNPQVGSAVSQVQPHDCVEMVARFDEAEFEDAARPVIVRQHSELPPDEDVLTGVKRLIRHRRSLQPESAPCSRQTSVLIERV